MENCLEEAPHGSQDYYPHYNLFQSSIFYDTDNFRVSYLSYKYDECLPSKSSANEGRSAEPPDKPPEPPEPPEPGAPLVDTTRMISKDDLYRDPDLFKSKFDEGQTTSNGIVNPTQQCGYDWTKQSWVKEGAPVVDIRDEGPKGRSAESDARVRVTSSKAESMMQKMGWRGGALGKTGDGITRPITPDTVYAFRSTAGFGQRTGPPKPPVKAPEAPAKPPASDRRATHNKKEVFRTNVLMHILEFVMDDTETELLFDPSLRQYERRHITHIVNTVVNEHQVHALGSAAQYQLGADIHTRNGYVLDTARRGEGDKRQLCIYKEPPENVYLITPDDFLPKHDITETEIFTENSIQNELKTENCMELDDDENPFLKSIKKSIKKDDEPAIRNKFETDCTIAKDSESNDKVCEVESPVTAEQKMIEFFLEFAETESFTELRFLGKFTDEQSAAVNLLLNDVALWSLSSEHTDGQTDVARACRAARCELREGANGTAEIHKMPVKSRDKD